MNKFKLIKKLRSKREILYQKQIKNFEKFDKLIERIDIRLMRLLTNG